MKPAPLRKITQVLRGADDAYGRQLVLLECGHRVAASAGAIYRARCRHCKAAAGVRVVDGAKK